MLLLYQISEQMAALCSPSLLPGLVVKAILCLGLLRLKSGQTQAAHSMQEDEDRDLQPTIPPTDLSSSARHVWAMDSCLPPLHAAWLANVTQGPPVTWPACSRSRHSVPVCGGQMGEKEDVEQLGYYEERWNWRVNSWGEEGSPPAARVIMSQPELPQRAMSEAKAT